MSRVVERFRTRRGAVLHLETTGEGPAVLALHGVGGGTFFFQGLAERLSPWYQVTALDLPGTGRSTSASPVEFQDWIDDIGEVLTRHIARPVVIVGHSLGTILALETWRARPDWIRGLVFVGGLPTPRPVVRERLAARIASMAVEGIDGWGARVSPGVFGPRAYRDAPEVVGLFERLFDAQDAAGYMRSLELLLAADASDVVPTVTIPCASISGSDDQYASPDAVAAFLAALPATPASVVLPGVGHMPFFEAPVEFARVVRGFLATVPGWAPGPSTRVS